jgi:hypothetical protein
MRRYSHFPTLWLRLCIAARVPADASLDTVHAKIDVIGRGTLQRIRDGVAGTQIRSIQAIADHLRVPVTDLLTEVSAQEQEAQWPIGVDRLVDDLSTLLDALDAQGQDAAAKALQALAAAPDSAKARAALTHVLDSVAPPTKQPQRVA